MKLKACIKSIASYLPEKTLTNKDFESFLDTSDEWILKRTGIKQRYIASETENTSDLAYKAAIKAIQRAKIQTNDIDLIIVATLSPDYFTMPSTAVVVANKLGLKGVSAFDISAACSGFIYMLELARSMVESGAKKNVLIIGAEKISSVLDYTDRTTCVLFGDGAGACVVSASEGKGIIDIHTGSDGEFKDLLCTKRSNQTKQLEPIKLEMKGNEVFKVAVKTLSDDVSYLLDKNKLKTSDIDLFIPHQANLRIISYVQEKLGLSDEQCVVCVDKFGNTSAASIPIAINEAYEQGRLTNGKLMLLDAFGGGFTWGSALAYFDGIDYKNL
ncbi:MULTISPECIES: beta-ketoacyl-ACP synthase III [unclassified Campylobacter]|uniref:beta-ketoacyl-ACP synthase III n=1 Tax=unclassified Campylobacter TaxID=2593542 RepID=UPI001BD94242|nr:MULTISPECIES: beta-ketoacyl-ACP synthase III [unclassified Campylobacter]MBT0878966.1 ketoacyl-ACP synthase III [Campylobacter sp. 2018MI01]MBT0880630.1 ketoacyl-ACP synthase III [Campylobacter sp. 2018MI27]MBT0884355.1 ketoacyl-ACP synthase III [Campylobacter sp. 2018MI10]